MNRKKAREFMMQVVYQMDVNNDFNIDKLSTYLKTVMDEKNYDYCEEMFSITCNKLNEIDKTIEKHSKNWTMKRMPKTDAAILRVATAEILYLNSMPESASINEAVELSKKYGVENSHKYINGILGSIVSDIKES